MNDCLFCKLVARDIPVEPVFENDHVLAFLDISPVNPGHTLVIPKIHSTNILDTDPAVLGHIATAVHDIAPAILKAVQAENFNLVANNGALSGQAVFHTHWHIIPRFENDGRDIWHGRPMSDEQLRAVREEIKSHL